LFPRLLKKEILFQKMQDELVGLDVIFYFKIFRKAEKYFT